MSDGLRDRVLSAARRVIRTEADAVAALDDRLDDSFVRAVELLASLEGRVVTTGVGKSGQIARRVASTLTSTGTPALYLHPVDALHGDLGMVCDGDAAIVFSSSDRAAMRRSISSSEGSSPLSNVTRAARLPWAPLNRLLVCMTAGSVLRKALSTCA